MRERPDKLCLRSFVDTKGLQQLLAGTILSVSLLITDSKGRITLLTSAQLFSQLSNLLLEVFDMGSLPIPTPLLILSDTFEVLCLLIVISALSRGQ